MIQPINLRDASYVTANLNPADMLEAECQIRHFSAVELAASMVTSPHSYVAYVKGQPAVVFGAQHYSATTVMAWALGTNRARRAIPAVTRFCQGPLRQQLVQDGYVWAEARSIASHRVAHGWLAGLGAKPVAALPGYGKRGEDFLLFRAAL